MENLKSKIQNLKWLTGLVMLAVVLCLPKFANATPTTTILIADTHNYRVIEVEPTTHNIIWQYGQTEVSGTGTNQLNLPVEASRLMNGNILITEIGNHRVIEVQPTGTSGGTIVWQYGETGVYGAGTNQLSSPHDAIRLSNGNTLIADYLNFRVIEVNPSGAIVWQYGQTGVSGSGPNQLYAPNEAIRLSNGNTLIADRGNHRVIEVNSSGTIVWQYGQTGSPGTGTNQLSRPADIVKLSNGNILITELGCRVIEVQPTGTSGGTIVWQYGGAYGSGPNQLKEPYEAIRLSNGNTLIVDSGDIYGPNWDFANHRVIEVTPSGNIVWQQGQTGVSGSGWNQLKGAADVEEIWRGIFNQVLVEYKDMANVPQPVVTAWAFTPVIPGLPPVLEVTKTVDPPGTRTPGTVLTYTIAFHNTGEGGAQDVVFTDAVPAGTVYGTGTAEISFMYGIGTIQYSHDGGATYNNSDSAPVTHIRWTIPAVGVAEVGTLKFSVRIQ